MSMAMYGYASLERVDIRPRRILKRREVTYGLQEAPYLYQLLRNNAAFLSHLLLALYEILQQHHLD